MAETVRLSLIYLEDMDVGVGTRDVRLFDNSIATLNKIHLGNLPQLRTTTAAATNAATSLSLSGLIKAGDRILGVTLKITTGLGTSAGLTSIQVGDGTVQDRWGSLATLTVNTETSQADFPLSEMPIYPSDTNVVISAIGGTFDGTGVLQVTAHYMRLTHRASA